MGLNIKNDETCRLASETQTGAITCGVARSVWNASSADAMPGPCLKVSCHCGMLCPARGDRDRPR